MNAGPTNLPVLGAMPRAAAAAKLREIGEDEAAEALERAAPPTQMGAGDWWPFVDKAWQHTAHAIGFLPAGGRERKHRRRRRGAGRPFSQERAHQRRAQYAAGRRLSRQRDAPHLV